MIRFGAVLMLLSMVGGASAQTPYAGPLGQSSGYWSANQYSGVFGGGGSPPPVDALLANTGQPIYAINTTPILVQ